jgi:hypothetical protein
MQEQRDTPTTTTNNNNYQCGSNGRRGGPRDRPATPEGGHKGRLYARGAPNLPNKKPGTVSQPGANRQFQFP